MKNKYKLALLGASLLLPVFAFGQGSTNLTSFTQIVNSVETIVSTLIPIVFGLGILAFFWGLVRYLFASDHDKEAAKKTMLWGVVAVFVMSAIWGLVQFIGNTFGVQQGQTIKGDTLNPL